MLTGQSLRGVARVAVETLVSNPRPPGLEALRRRIEVQPPPHGPGALAHPSKAVRGVGGKGVWSVVTDGPKAAKAAANAAESRRARVRV